VRVGRPPRAREERVALDGLEPDLHEAARDQSLEHRRGAFQLLGQVIERREAAERLEQLVQCTLLG
jgi:hypothetical protein